MNTSNFGPIIRTPLEFDIASSAIGWVTPQVLPAGVRGEILAITLREEIPGDISDLNVYICDGALTTLLSTPPIEAIFYEWKVGGITPSATLGKQSIAAANQMQWYQVRTQNDLLLGVEVVAVTGAGPAKLVFDVWTRVQATRSAV